ncbi:MAG: 3-deoxy-7-phosphoheptulonate synthase class II [Phycisphaerales bacterium]
MSHPATTPWSPTSWQGLPNAQAITYPDDAALAGAVGELRSLPPLVTSWEIERLRAFLAQAEQGKRFLLQGGDCAESLAECNSTVIANKLKILLQMSMVLVHGLKMPILRVGRFAGQYAKPRSSATETRGGVTLPSYYGDLINRPAFDSASRTPDPSLLVRAYTHSALTLNFVRALVEGGFADLHHPEYWDLSFMRHAGLAPALRSEYERMKDSLADGLRFMEALGEKTVDDLTRVEFFTSHEGLSLWYESAQTRPVPRRDGVYNLSTHMPWLGERTRQIGGAHAEYFRGIHNPVGVKLGPTASPAEVLELARFLNPANEAGKLVLIARMGAARIADALPPLLRATRSAEVRCLWVCDPMHGNTRTTAGGIKTRSFDDILHELTMSHAVHRQEGVVLGGVHFELTGEDVTECTGGALGTSEQDLATNYASACDPRLNYQQALEVAFLIARTYARR